MTNLSVFEFRNHKVRVVVVNGDPWFVAKDVCDVFENPNVSQVCKRLKDYERGIHNVDTPSGKQDMVCISESGLYRVTLTSRKEQAEPFQDWVCEEVLPTIRKTGKYSVNDQKKLYSEWRDYEKFRFQSDTQRVNLRKQLKEHRAKLNSSINDYFKKINRVATPGDFAKVADAINVALTGETSAQMKKRTNLEGSKLIADYMPENTLNRYSTTLIVTTNLILMDGYDPLNAVGKSPKIALPSDYEPQQIEFIDPLIAAERRIDMYLSGQLSLPWVK